MTTSADQFTCRSTTRKESTVAQCEILHTMYAYTVHVRLARKKIARILYIYQTKKNDNDHIMRSIYMHMMIIFFYIQMIEIVARIVES